jgi:hypothetical protein
VTTSYQENNMNSRIHPPAATTSTQFPPAIAIALGLTLASGLGACDGEVPQSPVEPTAHVTSALTANPFEWFRWTKGESTKSLRPTSTHVCALTMVRGEFKRDTSVRLFQANGNWIMGGANPGSNLLQMDAICEPLSAFAVDPGVTPANLGIFSANVSQNNSQTVTGLPQFSAPILAGVYGDFNGGGEKEFTTVDQFPTVTAKKGTSSGQLIAFASALSLGNARPRFLFDDPFTPEPSIHLVAGVLNPTCIQSDGCTAIAELAGNFCYLSSVSGDFKGADEWAQVFPDQATGQWKLQGYHSEAVLGGGSVFAAAQCLSLNQTHGTAVIH